MGQGRGVYLTPAPEGYPRDLIGYNPSRGAIGAAAARCRCFSSLDIACLIGAPIPMGRLCDGLLVCVIIARVEF